MKLRRGAEVDSRIPTGSMADIAFLLIIFFMVTAVFAATQGLELDLPTEPNEAIDADQDAVFIHVREGEVLVDCRPMTVDRILPYLEPRLTRNPNKPVILYTASEAAYREMVGVYDVLAGTHAGTRHGFTVRNLHVPTRSDIERYVELFGHNPLEQACPR